MLRIPRTVALISIACVLLASGCAKRETPVEAGIRTKTLLVGNGAEPASLDPHVVIAFTDFRVAATLFEGLTVLDERTSQPLPGVAERWEASADGLTYTFHLRANARWSNGDRVTAGDFAYAFRRMLTPALGAPYAYMLFPIKGAEAFNAGKIADFAGVGVSAPDDATLRIQLEQPTSYLPSLAAHLTWMPVHRATIEKFGRMEARDSAWTRPGNLVGNGAFVLQEWKPNARILVSKNPRYWDAARNRLEQVAFFPIEKTDAEDLAFRAGQLHVTYTLPPSKISGYRQQVPSPLRIDPFLNSTYLNYNVAKPPLNSPQVRRALALAIDRSGIADRIFLGAARPAPSFVPPECGLYTPPAGQAGDYAAARALLAEAGFPGGKGLPVLPLQTANDDRSMRTAELLQGTWQRELGVRVSIEPMEQKTHFQALQGRDSMLSITGWTADYADPYTFLEILRTGNGNNWTNWSSRAYDSQLDQANLTRDPAARAALLQRAESLMLSETPVAPLVWVGNSFLIHPAVKNWPPAPLGMYRFQQVELKP